MVTSKDILGFWFDELTPQNWFAKDGDLDQMIQKRFQGVHHQASQGELWSWRSSPKGSLAEIIVLDQFSRNMFRDSAQAFAFDGMALLLAQQAVEREWHRFLKGAHCAFLLMPYMHSESKIIHEQAIKLFDVPGLEYNLEYEYKHKAIIDRFGRYPHRNKVLERESTADEIEFLKEEGSSF